MMSLRLLLTVSGGIELLTGLLMLISPARAVSLLLGEALDSIATPWRASEECLRSAWPV